MWGLILARMKKDEPQHYRLPERCLWAKLIVRIYELSPLVRRHFGAEMHIIAFVCDTASVTPILKRIGEPTKAPVLSPARGPPPGKPSTGPRSFTRWHQHPCRPSSSTSASPGSAALLRHSRRSPLSPTYSAWLSLKLSGPFLQPRATLPPRVLHSPLTRGPVQSNL